MDNSVPPAADPPPSNTHFNRDHRPPPSTSIQPYPTRSDFLVADFAIANSLSFATVNSFYKLLHNPLFKRRAALASVTPLGGEMKDDVIKVAYDGEEREIKVPHINVLQVLRDVVGNPELAPHFKLHPERWFREMEDGTTERFIDEFMTADDPWEYHTKFTNVDANAMPYYIHLYSDESKLSTFGEIKCWPIYMWLSNLPRHIRIMKGNVGAILVGYLPIVDLVFPPTERKKPAFTAFRREVYHRAWSLILDPVAEASRNGVEMLFN
ncbi:hypothetical protein P7C70_g9533, partial [Phenoliferia sp. Uapishka_3]